MALEKLDPERKEKRAQAKKKLKANAEVLSAPEMKVADSVMAEVRRAVFLRDGGACTYRDPKTGRRCGTRRLLQIDHVKPRALGGGHELENLRLLCAAHNLHRARKTWPEVRH